MLVVVVVFEIERDQRDAFLALMLQNARSSFDLELGCKQFDVCADVAAPEVIILYEVYDDREAFTAHCRTAHFLEFDKLTRDLVVSKQVRLLERLYP